MSFFFIITSTPKPKKQKTKKIKEKNIQTKRKQLIMEKKLCREINT